MTTWKVSWNKNLYDYKKIIEDYKSGNVLTIKQSKGKGKMINPPFIGDIVFVSCNKQKIMKCEVVSNFVINEEEKNDIYNKGDIRSHSDNNTYLHMNIVEVYDNPEQLNGSQRTWIRFTPN